MSRKPAIEELERRRALRRNTGGAEGIARKCKRGIANRPSLPPMPAGIRAWTRICALSVAVAATGTAWAQQLGSPTGSRVMRAYYDDPLTAARAHISLDALETNYEEGYIVALATDEDIQAARRAGMRVVEDNDYTVIALPSELPAAVVQGTIAGFPCYRTVAETYASARAIVSQHPTFATWSTIGKSWKKTQNASEGDDLYVLRLTNSATSGTKPALLITAAVHAREYTTAELALRFAEYLADSYETDADVRWLLDHQEVHIMLQSNPDGRKRAEADVLWRKNHNTNHCPGTWPGIDLNRNFDFKWGEAGVSSNECANNYHGSSAASEPETRAIQTYMANLFPDARGPDDDDAAPAGTSGVLLDIHSYSQLVLWPWGHVDEAAPNGAALRTLGRKLAFFNDYLPLRAYGLYPTSGTTEDYGYGVLGRASFTYELGTRFFQDCSYFTNSILDDNLESLLYAFKVARTPYQTPSGPDIRDLSLSGGASASVVAEGTALTLASTIDDTRYKNSNGAEATQNIAAAEYYLDVPPWATGAAANAMSAADGAFDSSVENATATIVTTGLSAGRHTVFVRGRDSDDNWGAVGAIFLFVDMAPPSTPVAPTIEARNGQLGVQWTPPDSNGSEITGYTVRNRSRAVSSSWSAVGPRVDSRYTIAGLTNGEQYEVQVRAVNGVGGSEWSPSATGTPGADPPPPPPPPPPNPTVSVAASQAVESAGVVVFHISLSSATESTVTVDYATADGDGDAGAKAGSDYTATAGALTFPPGSRARQIRVPVTDDAEDEAEEETFTLTLRDPTNATLQGGGSALEVVGTIRDDDDPEIVVLFASSSYEVAEGGSVRVSVQLSADPEREVEISLVVGHLGGATTADYSGVPVSLTFSSNARLREFEFVATEDGDEDFGESVVLRFDSLPSGVSGAGEAVVSIGDDDTPPMAVIEVSGAECDQELCRAVTGEPVQFADTSTGPAASPLWDFGDGTGSSLPTLEHAWSAPGFYEVTLRVSDGERESSASRTFLIEASAPAGTCVPDGATRCLLDSRYAVVAEWRKADGESGAASVVHVGTNDSGSFRFFNRGNWEILIKVLDGCELNGHVWVYGATTTDLGYTIRVTDTVTDLVKEYRNEPGMPAPAITDGRAFGACAR